MKKSWMIYFWVLQASWLLAQQPMEEAIAAYQQANYEAAIALYEEVLASGQHSADLYYNLGNAYYKAGLKGKAVLHYERALLLDPGSTEARENLTFVQAQIPPIEQVPPFFLKAWKETVQALLPARIWAVSGLLLLWMGAAGVILWLLGQSRERKKQGFSLALAGFLLCTAPLWLAFSRKQAETNSPFAIVLTDGGKLHAAPGEESEERLILAEGWKVECVEQLNDWYKIKLANGEMGWTKAGMLEKL